MYFLGGGNHDILHQKKTLFLKENIQNNCSVNWLKVPKSSILAMQRPGHAAWDTQPNNRTRRKISGSYPQGKPFLNTDMQRTARLPTRGPFLAGQKLYLCLKNPVTLLVQGSSDTASLTRTAVGPWCISTVRSKVIRGEHQQRNKLKIFFRNQMRYPSVLSILNYWT